MQSSQLPRGELMPALTALQPDVRLGAADRTALLPLRIFWLRRFDFSRSCCTQPIYSRLVGLLHRALRVHAAARVRGRAAHGAEMLGRCWRKNDGLLVTHKLLHDVTLRTALRRSRSV